MLGRFLRVGAVIAGAAVLVAGCGGGSSSVSDEAQKAISRAETQLLYEGSKANYWDLEELEGLVPEGPDGYYPYAEMSKMLEAIADEKPDATVKVIGGDEKSLDAVLAKMANKVEDYWPDEVAEIERVRDSLDSN